MQLEHPASAGCLFLYGWLKVC